MTTKNQSFGQLKSFLHSMHHFIGLTFEKSATPSYKNCITSEQCLLDISGDLVNITINCMAFLGCDFKQVNDVTSCVAWSVDACDLNAIYFKRISILNRQSACGNVIFFTSNNL